MKKIFYALFLGIFLFIGTNSVGALSVGDYNGTSNDTGGPGGTCGDGSEACTYNNDAHLTVKMTLVYYDGRARTTIGGPIYITNYNVDDWAPIKELFKENGNYKPGYYYISTFNGGSHSYDNFSATVEQEVLNNIDTYLAYLGVSNKANLTNDTSKASAECGITCIGYRIVIEPVISWRQNGNVYFDTIKGMAATSKTVSNSAYFTDIGRIKLNLEFSDIGIGYTTVYNRNNVANANISLGYNIIDFFKGVNYKKCYGYKVGTYKLPKCDRKNSGSFGYIEQKLVEKKVKANESCPENYSETPVYGITMHEQPGKCKIQCIETAKESFPGSYGKIVNIGDLLVWPTDSSHKKTIGTNAFKISFSGELACTVTGSDRNTCKSYIENLNRDHRLYEFYRFESGVTLSYNDGEKNKSEELTCTDIKNAKLELKDYTSTTTIYGESADTFKITASKISCKLPKNYNRYIDKATNKTSSKPTSNYVDVGYSNLRTSKNAKAGTYNLSLIDIKLGFDDQFGSYANKKTYTCHYTMNSGNSSYKCPEGTKHSGMDLSAKMEDEKITYAEAVEKYCNSDDSCVCPADSDFEGTDLYSMVTKNKSCSQVQEENCYTACYDSQGKKHSCKGYSDLDSCKKALCNNRDSCYTVDGIEVDLSENKCSDFESKSACIDYYCPTTPQEEHPYCYTPDGVKIYLTACISGGKSEEECSKVCNKNSDEYKCKNTAGVGGEMNITDCVQTKMGQGLSLNDAIDACDKELCKLKVGKKIIYRVIDLSNPFPSYNADATVVQTGLKKGMFNDNLKGRYPGTNWNSETTVKREILNNRNVDGDKVYDSSPMYVFTLDSTAIKAIRKYNKTTTYDDFDLDCKINNSTACVSSFIHNHNREFGLTGGVYSGTLNKTNFYSHDNKSN